MDTIRLSIVFTLKIAKGFSDLFFLLLLTVPADALDGGPYAKILNVCGKCMSVCLLVIGLLFLSDIF